MASYKMVVEDNGRTICFEHHCCSSSHQINNRVAKFIKEEQRSYNSQPEVSCHNPQVKQQQESISGMKNNNTTAIATTTAANVHNVDMNNNNAPNHYETNYYNHDNQQQKLKRDVIKEICPLIKHNKNLKSRPIKFLNSSTDATGNGIGRMPHHLETGGGLPVATGDDCKEKFMPNAAAAAVTARLMSSSSSRSETRTNTTTNYYTGTEGLGRSAKPLRQINIVGQLNHSASKGFLLILNLMVLMLTISLGPNGNNHGGFLPATEASVWPFSAIVRGGSSSGNGNTGNQSKSLLPWPLGQVAQQQQNRASAANANSNSKRKARHSESSSQSSSSSQQTPSHNLEFPATAAPMSQQLHYFWNHDQIEPKLVANEANKILAEAQMQTNQLALGQQPPGSQQQQDNLLQARESSDTMVLGKQVTTSPSGSDSSQRQQAADPMLGSASGQQLSMLQGPEGQSQVFIPQAIQQQLTGMVLQMQRQQQASMMMQPRFSTPSAALAAAAAAAGVAAQRRLSMSPQQQHQQPALSFMNPMSRYWMSGSTQYPVLAALPSQAGNFNQMLTSESMQHASVAPAISSFPMGPRVLPAVPATAGAAATIAGVPVFGPFMVSPTVSHPAIMHPHYNHHHHSHPSPVATSSPSPATRSSHQSAANKLASSFMSRRKSWPLFGLGSSLSDKVSLLGSSSQPRVSVVPPPQSIQQQHQQQQLRAREVAQQQLAALNTLPLDTMALVEMASSQLASVIASQVQNRLAQQKLAMALAKAIEQTSAPSSSSSSSGDTFQTSASISNIQHSSPPAVTGGSRQQKSAGSTSGGLLQAPYSIPTDHLLNGHGNLHLTSFEQQQLPQQSFDIHGGLSLPPARAINPFVNVSDFTYGSRLKRRHLNTLLSQQQQQQQHHYQQQHRKQQQSQTSAQQNRKSLATAGGSSFATQTITTTTSSPNDVGSQWTIDSLNQPQQLSASPTDNNYQEPIIEQYFSSPPSLSPSSHDKFNSLESVESPAIVKVRGSSLSDAQLVGGSKQHFVTNLKNSLAPMKTTTGVRIVKKDASSLLDLQTPSQHLNRNRNKPKQAASAKQLAQGSLSSDPSGDNSNMRHLFMIMTTESPALTQKFSSPQSNLMMVDHVPNATDYIDSGVNDNFISFSHELGHEQKQTQLRRLKRSAAFGGGGGGRGETKSSNWGSSWKSMLNTAEVAPYGGTSKPIVAPKASGFLPMESALATDSSLIHESTTTADPTSRWGAYTVKPNQQSKSWSSVDPTPPAEATKGPSPKSQILMRRQSMGGDGQTGSSSTTAAQSANVTTSVSTSTSTVTTSTTQTPRQDRSMKVKRISVSSASVLHHPVSKNHEKPQQQQLAPKQGFILSGVPVSLKPTSGQTSGSSSSSGGLKVIKPSEASNGQSQQQQPAAAAVATPTTTMVSIDTNADPMSASLSESARVVNYFQNVDNEKSPDDDPTGKQQDQSNNKGSQAPQINVGFSAPKVTSFNNRQQQQNETNTDQQQQQQQQTNYNQQHNMDNSGNADLRRQPSNNQYQQQQQQSGNSMMPLHQSGAQVKGPLFPASQSMLTQAMILNLRQRQQQQQQLAGANSADISSSATRNVPYTINNMLPPGLSSDGSGQSQQQQFPRLAGSQGGPAGANGQLAMGIDPTGTSNHARVGSIIAQSSSGPGSLLNLQGKIFNAFLGLGDKSQARVSSASSSSMVPIFGATSQTRQSIVAPNGSKPQGTNSNNSQQQQQQQQQSSTGSSSSSPSSSSLSPSSSPSSSSSSQQQSLSSSYDRTSSADQSSNYNEEMLPPTSGGSNNQMFGTSSPDMPSGSNDQQQQRGGNSNSPSSSYNSMMDQSSAGNSNDQQPINNVDGSMLGYGNDNTFGSRNPSMEASQSMGPAGSSNGGGSNGAGSMDLSGFDQGGNGMDLAKFNQQQQDLSSQSQQQLFANSFNQTDNLVSDGPDSASALYGNGAGSSSSSGSGPFGQPSFQQQLAAPSEDPMGLTPQAMLASQQPQFYSPQQMQALGAAVANYNQRFNQQLQNHYNSQTGRNMFAQSMDQQQQQPMRHSSTLSQQVHMPSPNSALWTGVDEEAAAGAAAAAGIPTYPNAAQLLAIQSQGHMVDANGNLMMAGTEQRSELGADLDGGAKVKKAKKKSGKQVSHHYHFNNFGSPFEDPDSQLLNPLEIIGTMPQAHDGYGRPKPKPKAPKEEEEKQEEEPQKPKKKSLLRRFSIRNLFKRFRKDKKKGNENSNNNNNNNNNNSNSNNDESSNNNSGGAESPTGER